MARTIKTARLTVARLLEIQERGKKLKAQINWAKVRNAVRIRPYVFHWMKYYYRPNGAGRKREIHMFELDFGNDRNKTLEPASYDQSLMVSYFVIWFQLLNRDDPTIETTMSVAELRPKIFDLCRILSYPEKQMDIVLRQLMNQTQPQHLDFLRRLREYKKRHYD